MTGAGPEAVPRTPTAVPMAMPCIAIMGKPDQTVYFWPMVIPRNAIMGKPDQTVYLLVHNSLLRVSLDYSGLVCSSLLCSAVVVAAVVALVVVGDGDGGVGGGGVLHQHSNE